MSTSYSFTNEPIIPPSGVICQVEGCDNDAVRTWVVGVTDDRGQRLFPRRVDYCRSHGPANRPL